MAMKNFYPPVMPTTIPTFIVGTRPRIHFQVSAYMSINAVNSNIVQVTVRKQANNALVINKDFNSGSEIYTTIISQDAEGYYIEIDPRLVPMNAGEYYKVQARFLSSNIQISQIEFKSKINEYVEDYMSEWSTVCLIRPISKPSINLAAFDAISNTKQIFLQTSSLTLKGKLEFADNDEIETLDSYKIWLYEGDKSSVTTSDELIVETDWKFNSSYTLNEINCLIGYNLEDRLKYLLKVECVTSGGYILDKYYYFTPLLSTLAEIENIEAVVKNDSEQGCNRVVIKSTDETTFSGFLVLKRASNEDGFKIWTDLQCFYFSNEKVNISYKDFLIEHGMIYRYQLVIEDDRYNRSTPYDILAHIEEKDNIRLIGHKADEQSEIEVLNGSALSIMGELDTMSLVGSDTEMLNIKFDPTVSNFQYTVVESKTDTLGGKYPFIRRNGDTYYRQFSIGGLITHFCEDYDPREYSNANIKKLDSTRDFSEDEVLSYGDSLVEKRNKYVYNMETPLETSSSAKKVNYFAMKDGYDRHFYKKENADTNSEILYHRFQGTNDELLEKKYRDYVISFLYKNAVRLFKSPTEGNVLVKLMNISLTPKQELNRIVYDFTATAFEIDEFTIENCIKYGIHTKNTFENRGEQHTYTDNKIGQLLINETGSARVEAERNGENATDINVFDLILNHWVSSQSLYKPTINYLNWMRIQFTSQPYRIYVCRPVNENLLEQPTYIADENNETEYAAGNATTPCSIYLRGNKKKIIFTKTGYQLFMTMGYLLEINGTVVIVPPHGYYELAGKGTEIYQMKILGEAKRDALNRATISATVDFEANVFAVSNTNYLQASYLYYLVGQVNRLTSSILRTSENIVQTMIGQHHNRDTTKLTVDNKISAEVIGLSYVSFEGQPYTKIYIKDSSDDKPELHILNSTGVLTLVCDNTYIEEIYIDLDNSSPTVTSPVYEERDGDGKLIIHTDKYAQDMIINYVALVRGGLYG